MLILLLRVSPVSHTPNKADRSTLQFIAVLLQIVTVAWGATQSLRARQSRYGFPECCHRKSPKQLCCSDPFGKRCLGRAADELSFSPIGLLGKTPCWMLSTAEGDNHKRYPHCCNTFAKGASHRCCRSADGGCEGSKRLADSGFQCSTAFSSDVLQPVAFPEKQDHQREAHPEPEPLSSLFEKSDNDKWTRRHANNSDHTHRAAIAFKHFCCHHGFQNCSGTAFMSRTANMGINNKEHVHALSFWAISQASPCHNHPCHERSACVSFGGKCNHNLNLFRCECPPGPREKVWQYGGPTCSKKVRATILFMHLTQNPITRAPLTFRKTLGNTRSLACILLSADICSWVRENWVDTALCDVRKIDAIHDNDSHGVSVTIEHQREFNEDERSVNPIHVQMNSSGTYKLIGYDLDECSATTNNCGIFARHCRNTDGSYECDCFNGTTRFGWCECDQYICGLHGRCNHASTKPHCICDEGWYGPRCSSPPLSNPFPFPPRPLPDPEPELSSAALIFIISIAVIVLLVITVSTSYLIWRKRKRSRSRGRRQSHPFDDKQIPKRPSAVFDKSTMPPPATSLNKLSSRATLKDQLPSNRAFLEEQFESAPRQPSIRDGDDLRLHIVRPPGSSGPRLGHAPAPKGDDATEFEEREEKFQGITDRCRRHRWETEDSNMRMISSVATMQSKSSTIGYQSRYAPSDYSAPAVGSMRPRRKSRGEWHWADTADDSDERKKAIPAPQISTRSLRSFHNDELNSITSSQSSKPFGQTRTGFDTVRTPPSHEKTYDQRVVSRSASKSGTSRKVTLIRSQNFPPPKKRKESPQHRSAPKIPEPPSSILKPDSPRRSDKKKEPAPIRKPSVEETIYHEISGDTTSSRKNKFTKKPRNPQQRRRDSSITTDPRFKKRLQTIDDAEAVLGFKTESICGTHSSHTSKLA